MACILLFLEEEQWENGYEKILFGGFNGGAHELDSLWRRKRLMGPKLRKIALSRT